MNDSKVVTQVGNGYLVLKSGDHTPVEWQIDLCRDDLIGNGRIHGNAGQLAAAANDGCATLHLDAEVTVAIAIDRHEDEEASFSTLLVSSVPSIFRSQMINGSGSILDAISFRSNFRTPVASNS